MGNEMNATKDQLRKEIKKKRKNLSKDELREKSTAIKNRLFKMKLFRHAQTILFYVSYSNEVYTHDMIKESIAIGKHVIVPKSVTQDNTLILSKLKSWGDLEIGAYNILEPKKETIGEVDVESIDLIIVPGVVCDESGNRIGHGKGYYDRLLNKSQNMPAIGLAFELQMVDNIESEQHDEKIDVIITEDRIMKYDW